jgi:preprotein translocase SecE subunit
MALSTRRSKKEEDEVLDEETELEDEEVAKSVTPAISDRRRRRMLAQGLDPDAAVTTTKPKRVETIERDDDNKGRAKEGGGNIITRTIANIREYFRDVRSELNKVHWPNRQETERLTRIVVVVTAAFSVALGAVSFIIGLLATAISDPNQGTIAGIVSIVIIVVVAFLWLIRDRIFPSYE